MTQTQSVAKWVAGIIVTLSVATFFFAVSYGIFDSTRARASGEKVAEQRAQAASRRIDSYQKQVDELHVRLAESEYLRGLTEGTAKQTGGN